MKRFIKPLTISITALGLLISGSIYANQKSHFQSMYTLKNLSPLPNATTGSSLNIQLSDKLLLSQATQALNEFQKQGVTFNRISVSAEDGLTVNLNEPFFISISHVIDNQSTLEIASSVGISTDPNTLLTLSKLPIQTLQIDPSAYQSAFSAAPDSSARNVKINFGTLEQVDAFNRAIFYGSVILNQQTFKLNGTAPVLTRFLANLDKPVNKKVLFGTLDLNFTKGQITDEVAKYLGGSIAHETSLAQIQLGSSLSFEQSRLFQSSFSQGMNIALQNSGAVVPRMAIFGQKIINWSPLASTYAEASGGDPVIFITNGQLKDLLFVNAQMQHITVVTGKPNKDLFQAAQAGQIAGAFVLLDKQTDKERLERQFNNNNFISGETPIGYLAGISQNKTILNII